MGARIRPLGLCVVCPQVLGARGRLSYFCLLVVCLPVLLLAESRGRHVSGVCLVYRVGQVSVDIYA